MKRQGDCSKRHAKTGPVRRENKVEHSLIGVIPKIVQNDLTVLYRRIVTCVRAGVKWDAGTLDTRAFFEYCHGKRDLDIADAREEEMEQKNGKIWPFRIQFITLALIPFILVTINIPDSVAQASALMETVRRIGIIAVVAVLLFSFPVGMIGFLNARDEKVWPQRNRVTMILGVINCILGAMFVGIVLMYLFFTLLGWI